MLSVDKDSNGYRNYSMQDVKTLKKISVYRKLGIGIKDIQTLLEKDDKSDSGNLKITNLDRLIFTKNGEFTI